jgi:hypothetical protein
VTRFSLGCAISSDRSNGTVTNLVQPHETIRRRGAVHVMTLRSFSMHRTFAAALAGLALAGAGSAAAAPNIKGSFGFTGTSACLVAVGHVGDPNTSPPMPNPTPGVALPNAGFNANLQPNDTPNSEAFSFSNSVEGIRTFDGHGHGTVKGTAVSITVRPTPGPGGFPHFPPSAGSAEFSYRFTYVVHADGSWTATMVPGSYTETFTAGPRNGQTSTVELPPASGMMSEDGDTLISAADAPTVETVTFSNGDVHPQICHRSRVFIRLKDHDRH